MDTNEFTKGDYLNEKTCRTGDIVEILGEGEVGEIKDIASGKLKPVLNLPVKVNGQLELTYTPTRKTLTMLQDIFKSADSATWIGQKFQVKIKEMEVAGKELKVVRPSAIIVKA